MGCRHLEKKGVLETFIFFITFDGSLNIKITRFQYTIYLVLNIFLYILNVESFVLEVLNISTHDMQSEKEFI
jgi:hypothetical protein